MKPSETASSGSAAARGSRPNILLFLPDQHRHDWLGTTPNLPARTPNLDAMAGRGMRFTNAITPSPLCAPARACLAAGVEYDRCEVPGNDADYPLNKRTTYGLLRKAGYHVMGCGKFDLAKAKLDWAVKGTRRLKKWGFSDGVDCEGKWDGFATGTPKPKGPYWAYLHEVGLAEVHHRDMALRKEQGPAAAFPTQLPDEAYCDNWLARIGLNLLRHAPAGKPWFLQVNFVGPHDPWDVTERMAKQYEGVDFPHPIDADQFTTAQYCAVRRNYSAMVENIDRWVGLFQEELGRRGELEKTLLVYSSDHGEMLGDHDAWGKSLPFQASIGVPLIFCGPGVHRGYAHDGPATILDLTATFLDYAGVPIPDDVDSRSMLPLLARETSQLREAVICGLADWRLAFEGRYKLVQYKGQEPVLRDIGNDPAERRDIAKAQIAQPVAEYLRDFLPEF